MTTRPRKSAGKKKEASPRASKASPLHQTAPKVPIPQDRSYNVRPLLQTGDRTAEFYVNYAEANSTIFDLVITLGKFPARFNIPDLERIARDENVVLVSPVQVTMPIGFAPHFVKMIVDAVNAHSAQWGASPQQSVHEDGSDEITGDG